MPSRAPTDAERDNAAAKPNPASAPVEPWASIDEAAAHLGVRKDSVYRWIESRGLPARKIGKLWKLKLSEVDVWVNASGANASDGAQGEAGSGEAGGRAQPASRPMVMVIDDEAMVRDTVGDFLTDAGYRVVLATNGAHALKLLASAEVRPSVILLDLKMPDVDGWQFRELQQRNPATAEIPVIVLTGTPNATVRDAAVVLRKPLKLPVIGKAIRTVLENAREVEP